MDATYWHKQTPDKALFPELLWSRPENRRHAGKLLIIGGNGYEFKAPANAYGDALDAGVGSAKVLLPSSMQKVVHDIFPEAEFAPHTPSGSFARIALAQVLDLADWADAVLLAGDLGRNSETAILLESLLSKYSGQLTLTKDAVNYFLDAPTGLLARPDTLLVITTAQLQRLASGAGSTSAFTSDMDLLRTVEWLHEFSKGCTAHFIIKHLDTLFVASCGQVSTTPVVQNLDAWRVHTAAHASTWWLQNPGKPFEALTTSLIA
jgi:hypothetical protein